MKKYTITLLLIFSFFNITFSQKYKFLEDKSTVYHDYTFCNGLISVKLIDGGNAEMTRYSIDKIILKKVYGTYSLYGKGNPTEVIKITFEGKEYRYDMIRDGKGIPSLIYDSQGRKYNLCKIEEYDKKEEERQNYLKLLDKWRNEAKLLNDKYTALKPEINKILNNPIRVSYLEVANKDVEYKTLISDAIIYLKDGWRIPTINELSLIYKKSKKTLKGVAYLSSDDNPNNNPGSDSYPFNYYNDDPRENYSFWISDTGVIIENFFGSSQPPLVRFVRNISGPVNSFSKNWDWFISERNFIRLNVTGRRKSKDGSVIYNRYGNNLYHGVKLNDNKIKDYPYYPIYCAALPIESNAKIKNLDSTIYKIKYTLLTGIPERQQSLIKEKLSLYIDENNLPLKDNNKPTSYKRIFLMTSMILKDINKIELFSSDSILCSSVKNLRNYKIDWEENSNDYLDFYGIADDINGTIVWPDNSKNHPNGYDILFSAPMKKDWKIKLENFEKIRFFYLKFTTTDGKFIFTDKFPIPYDFADSKYRQYPVKQN